MGSLRSNMINNVFALRNLYHKAATDQHIDLYELKFVEVHFIEIIELNQISAIF